MGSYIFRLDLEDGQKFEDKFASEYSDQYRITKTQDKGQVKTHDGIIHFPDGDLKYECKYDRKAHQTGNIAVEIYNKYRDNPTKIIPAGLSATEADIYVFGFAGFPEVYAIDTNKLKWMVENKKYFDTRDFVGDRWDTHEDGCATIALFKKDWFLKHCELLYKSSN